jgi:hypothetical protein
MDEPNHKKDDSQILKQAHALYAAYIDSEPAHEVLKRLLCGLEEIVRMQKAKEGGYSGVQLAVLGARQLCSIRLFRLDRE